MIDKQARLRILHLEAQVGRIHELLNNLKCDLELQASFDVLGATICTHCNTTLTSSYRCPHVDDCPHGMDLRR